MKRPQLYLETSVWNLKHLANFKKMELINAVNMKAGYFKRLELITPMEVSDEEI